MFIHLFKSRKSHGHLATLHCSGVAQNTCTLEFIYFTVQLLYFLSILDQKVGIPQEKDIYKYRDRGGALSECGGCTIAFTLVQKEETLALASSP